MSIRTALTRLASLSVPAVTHNYDVDALPESLNRVQLPALLVLPITPPATRLTRSTGEGFQSIGFSGGPRTVTVAVTHLLLVAPIVTGRGSRSHLPNVVDLMDAYCLALAADPLLDDTLLEPAHVQIEPGDFTYGHATYHGCAFRHTWLIQV
ncbi:MAG: hypothetical protein LCI00_28080 [Chloroflexi bacterium]|nr:hypothetical protein [Chloroflexota bacterium]MCC6893894.1 hypothetical protein [Anaerolineae bacterium]